MLPLAISYRCLAALGDLLGLREEEGLYLIDTGLWADRSEIKLKLVATTILEELPFNIRVTLGELLSTMRFREIAKDVKTCFDGLHFDLEAYGSVGSEDR